MGKLHAALVGLRPGAAKRAMNHGKPVGEHFRGTLDKVNGSQRCVVGCVFS